MSGRSDTKVLSSRELMVAGAADMLSREGLARTSVRELAKHAGTPLGSTYHYFPGGKAQLAREAVQWSGKRVADALEEALQQGPVVGVRSLLEWWRSTLINSDFEAGCPVLSIALTESHASDSDDVIAAADATFISWAAALTDSFIAHGAAAPDARRLGTVIVCAVEGSVGLCRASKSTSPLDDVEQTLTALIVHALDTAPEAHSERR